MSKLEQKLIELGYECKHRVTYDKYEKSLNLTNTYTATIEITVENKKIKYSSVWHPSYIRCQQDIDNVQQVFNQLQKDLKELETLIESVKE